MTKRDLMQSEDLERAFEQWAEEPLDFPDGEEIIAKTLQRPRHRASRRWVLMLAPATALAVFVGVLLPTLLDPELETDQLLVLQAGTPVEVTPQLELTAVGRPAEVKLETKPKRVICYLRRGGVRFRVKRSEGREFSVKTAHGLVTVVGTEFLVDVSDDLGSTRVEVTSGRVRWRDLTTGEEMVLGPGQTLSTADEHDAIEEEPAAEPAPLAEASRVEQRDEHASPKKIRAQLARGEIKRARQLLSMAKRQRLSNRREAELALVAAEIELTAKRFAAAQRQYLRVVTQFPNSTQAEVALFAAARLGAEVSGHVPQPGTQLLQRYLDTYPRGRFALEAKALMRQTDATP